jgi:acyl-coenzyme A thioesterase PaaI-like protein
VATGRVLKSGKSLTVCNGDVVAYEGEKPTLIATILTTMFMLQPR